MTSANDEQGTSEDPQTRKSVNLRWLFSRQGLPVLIALAGLLLSITVFVLQEWRFGIKLYVALEPAGVFSDGTLLNHIIKPIEEEPGPVYVLTDFAGYGMYSHPALFQRIFMGLKARARDSVVKCTFLNDAQKRRVMAAQFSEYDPTAPGNRDKVRYFVERNPYGVRALESLNKHQTKPIEASNITTKQLLELLIMADRYVIQELIASNIEVREYPYMITFHAWCFGQEHAVMSFVDFKGAVDERGFECQGEPATAVREIVQATMNEADKFDGQVESNATGVRDSS